MIRPTEESASNRLRATAIPAVLIALTFFPTAQGSSQVGPAYEGLDASLVQSSDPANSSQFIDFGHSVDLDQDLMVVGAPSEDSAIDGTSNVGAAYLFERQAGSWVRIQKLRAPVERQNGEFGAAVAVARGSDINGPIDFLFVGEPLFAAPQVQIYSRTPGNPFTLDSTHSGDASSGFGKSVDLDFFLPPNSPTGDPLFFAAVGADNSRSPDDLSNSQRGSVVIFQRSGGPPTWGPTWEFFGEPNQRLGESVSLDGPIVLAAAALDGLGIGAGGARWYSQANFEGTIYVYAGDCQLLPNAQAAHVGKKTVASNGNLTAAFGMPEDDEIAFNNGKVLIFDLLSCIGNVITPFDTLYAPDTSVGASFGASLAFFGTTLAVGAPGTLNSDSGKVYLFERGVDNTDWNLATTLTLDRISPTTTACRGASALALDDDHLVAGCPRGGNPQHEAGYVFSLEIFSDGFESGDVAAWQ